MKVNSHQGWYFRKGGKTEIWIATIGAPIPAIAIEYCQYDNAQLPGLTKSDTALFVEWDLLLVVV